MAWWPPRQYRDFIPMVLHRKLSTPFPLSQSHENVDQNHYTPALLGQNGPSYHVYWFPSSWTGLHHRFGSCLFRIQICHLTSGPARLDVHGRHDSEVSISLITYFKLSHCLAAPECDRKSPSDAEGDRSKIHAWSINDRIAQWCR